MACEKCRPATGLYKSASDVSRDQVIDGLKIEWEGHRISQKKRYLEAKDKLTGKALDDLVESFNKYEGVYKARYDEMVNRISAVADEDLEKFKEEFDVTTLPAVKFN